MARRIPIVSRDELSAEHQAAYDEVAGIWGACTGRWTFFGVDT